MFKRFSIVLVILIAIVSLCSCKSEPELSKEEDKTAAVGIYASAAAMAEYADKGSYAGISVKVSDDKSVAVFSLDNVSISTNLSGIDASWGTQTITVGGEVVMKYEAPPAEYPRSMTFNLVYSFGGKNHTLELKERETGVSSATITFFKFDGKEYDSSKIKL